MEIIYEWILDSYGDSTYQDEVFLPVFIITLIVCAVLSMIFYIGLGRWKPGFHKLGSWVITLILIVAFSFFFAIQYATGALDIDFEDADNYAYGFGSINALYAAIFFAFFSLLFKRFSIHAKYTPF